MDESACMEKKKDEKITNLGKSDRSPSRYQQGIEFLKTNTLPIGYLQGI